MEWAEASAGFVDTISGINEIEIEIRDNTGHMSVISS